MEAIKLLLDLGKPLVGNLLHYDALNVSFRKFSLRPDPECILCSKNSTFKGIGNEPTHSHTKDQPNQIMKEITVTELSKRLEEESIEYLLDVRNVPEREAASIGGDFIPLPKLPESLEQIPKDKEIIIYCKLGGRSARACEFLMASGFENVTNVVGGIDAWREQIDPSLPPA
ncbi:rhodanese-like domain-containing protein [Akkermansiaceae bacterium]|nr:rhodanese-like domain-containing protein [Akkermansiaceae bacterium]